MFNDARWGGSEPRQHLRAVEPAMSPRRSHRTAASQDGVKSATRALEIIELFGIYGGALSVSDVSGALSIPQSSSSILLKAMNKAGFIDRDRRTRKYLPSLRSAFLGNRVHDALFRRGDLLQDLDRLAAETGCSARLGIRNGISVQYAHISWPEPGGDRLRIRPGAFAPICHDALGAMLLIAQPDEEIRAIVRHVNAVAETPAVQVESFLSDVERGRREGVLETGSNSIASERVLAIQLPTGLEVPAAIGLYGPVDLLDKHRPRLVERLVQTASRQSMGQGRVSIRSVSLLCNGAQD